MTCEKNSIKSESIEIRLLLKALPRLLKSSVKVKEAEDKDLP